MSKIMEWAERLQMREYAKKLKDKTGMSAEKIGVFFSKTPDAVLKFGKEFKDSDLWSKISKAGMKIGSKALYMVLAMYYGLGNASLRDKALIIGALGYFIFPGDIIPDFLPGGYADDFAAISAIFKIVKESLKPEAFEKARTKTDSILGQTPKTDVGECLQDETLGENID